MTRNILTILAICILFGCSAERECTSSLSDTPVVPPSWVDRTPGGNPPLDKDLVGEVRRMKSGDVNRRVESVALTNYSDVLVALGGSNGIVEMWDLSTSEMLYKVEAHYNEDSRSGVDSIAFSPDGSSFVTGGQGGEAKIWNALTGEHVHTFGKKIMRRPLQSVHYSPNSKYIVLTRFPGLRIRPGGGVGITRDTLQVWDIESGQMVAKRNLTGGAAFKAAFTQDGRHILAISLDGDVNMIEVSSMRITRSIRVPAVRLAGLPALSPDKQFLATVCENSDICLFDMETGEVLKRFQGHGGMVNTINYCPKLECIVTGAEDRTVRVWDVMTGKERYRFTGHKDWVNDAKISNDGTMVISAAKDIRLWGMPKSLEN